MAISIKKITEHIGAEIGCDCRLDQLSESDFADVVKAFDEHSVLVFRGQPLSDEKQISFSKRFGSLETTVNSNPAGGGTVMTVFIVILYLFADHGIHIRFYILKGI